MVTSIANSENVARILRRDWFEDGRLMHVAFALRKGESYISVNRPSVESFNDDVSNFVLNHFDYAFGEDFHEYCSAILNVGDIRDIHVLLEDEAIDIDVDVESRDTHVKSHAGIFTRYENMNLKIGDNLNVDGEKKAIPVDDILLKVRLQLLHKAKCFRTKLI